MEFFSECNSAAIVLGVRKGYRTVSLSFFFDKDQIEWIKRAERYANDIHVFWRFRYSNTVEVDFYG